MIKYEYITYVDSYAVDKINAHSWFDWTSIEYIFANTVATMNDLKQQLLPRMLYSNSCCHECFIILSLYLHISRPWKSIFFEIATIVMYQIIPCMEVHRIFNIIFVFISLLDTSRVFQLYVKGHIQNLAIYGGSCEKPFQICAVTFVVLFPTFFHFHCTLPCYIPLYDLDHSLNNLQIII